MPYSVLFVRKFRCFLLVVLRLASRMLRMLISRVSAILAGICRKLWLLLLVVLMLTSRKLQMVIPRTWALLSTIVLKVLLFFASSFQVGF